VLVTGVFDGATVKLDRSNALEQTAAFDLPGLWFGVARPLAKGEKLHADQEFPRCERQGDPSGDQTVADPSGLPAPVVIEPLCTGAVSVRVLNLTPGALVHLQVDGTTYTGIAPQQANWGDFFVAALTGGHVSATQEACNVKSGPSNSASVEHQPPVTSPAEIPGPLVACARAVRIVKAHPGAVLQVWANHGGVNAPISDLAVVGSAELTVGVAPFLRQDDEVWVEQFGCSATSTKSALVKVLPTQQPTAPVIATPVYSGAATVVVKGVVPGALVEVYVATAGTETWRFAGAAIADGDSTTVGLQARLVLRDMVRARQTICGTQAAFGPSATAVVPPPAMPVNLKPANGSTGIGTRPTFTWSDGGAGTDAAATGYELQLLSGSSSVVGLTAVPAASWIAAADLGFHHTLTFQVRAVNASGRSQFAQTVVTTHDAPAPVAPLLTSYDVGTKTLKGTGFLHSQTVHVRLSMLGNYVTNSYGQNVTDTRNAFPIQVQSDANGAISAVINPDQVLSALVLDDTYYLHGAASGETMHWSANDGRQNPADLTGTLWSNTLNVTAP
jgi:hypothetical protein